MKKRLKLRWCLAAVLSFLYISCNKHHDTPTADCITRIDASQTATVSAAQMDSINRLFSSNGLSTTGLQFYSFFSASIVEPGFFGTQEQVAANVFYNGLPVFADDQYFIFNAGQYQPNGTASYTGPVPPPDTTSRQTLEDLRTAWLTHYQQDTIFGGASASRPYAPGTAYSDSCLLAELGYLDAATFANGPRTYGVSLVKAWKVSPLSGGYPMVYVQDSTGTCVPVQEFVP